MKNNYLPSTPIKELTELPKHVITALTRKHSWKPLPQTFGELQQMSTKQLKAISGIGTKGLVSILLLLGREDEIDSVNYKTNYEALKHLNFDETVTFLSIVCPGTDWADFLSKEPTPIRID